MPKEFYRCYPKDMRASVYVGLYHHHSHQRLPDTTISIHFLSLDGGHITLSLSNARKMHERLGTAIQEAKRRGLE